MKEIFKEAGFSGKRFYAKAGLFLGSQATLISLLIQENNKQNKAIERINRNQKLSAIVAPVVKHEHKIYDLMNKDLFSETHSITNRK